MEPALLIVTKNKNPHYFRTSYMYLQLTCPRVDPTCGLNGQLISDSSTPSLKTQHDSFSQKYLFSPQSKALNVWLHVAHINWTKQRPCEHFAFWSQGQNAPYVTAYVVFTWYQDIWVNVLRTLDFECVHGVHRSPPITWYGDIIAKDPNWLQKPLDYSYVFRYHLLHTHTIEHQ